MAALASVALASQAPQGAVRAADPVARWHPIIAEASARLGVPADWIERVIRAESGGRTSIAGSPIRSSAGAIGLMQLMPKTWAAMRIAWRLGADPDDPHDNIVAGTAYLRLMIDRFGYPGAFAAYNAGPERYAAYLAGRQPLPSETIGYLAGVTGGRASGIIRVTTPPRALLFALRRDLGERYDRTIERPTGDGLFAIRKGVP